MKSAEERAFIYTDQMTGKFPQSWKEQVALGKESFLAGYHEGIRACIEELRSIAATRLVTDAYAVYDSPTAKDWADWLEKRMKEGG